MNRILVCTLAILICTITNGQNIPNGNFETWKTVSTSHLQSWLSTGNVTQTSDAYEGAYAVRMDNVAATKTQGYIATGPFSNNNLQGIPYDEQPLSMRFRAKYNLAIGDKAQVAALFTLQGNILAFVNFYIEGSSADTFVYFSVPITWQVSTLPDSVGILMSSIDLDQGSMNGDGYVVVDDFHFASISTRNRVVPNGDFNNWANVNNEILPGWFTTDDYIKQFTGTLPNPPFVKKSTQGRNGGFALEMKNQSFFGDTIAGVAFTGSSLEETQKPSFPISQKWKYLEGYYKFTPDNGDTAAIACFVFKSGVPIGIAQAVFIQQKTEYTYFAAEISYYVSVVPDSASLFAAPCNPDLTRGAGSWLLVDDLRFTDQNLGVFSLHYNKLTIYPNPFKDLIRVNGIDHIESAGYTVLNAQGKLIREGVLTTDSFIDMRDADAGIYYLHIEGENINTTKILIKE